MDGISPVNIAEIIAITVAFMKVMDILIGSLMRRMSPTDHKLSLEDKRMIKALYDMHNKYDEDGAPLWYVPRSWSSTQSHILETVGEIAHIQTQLANTVERCVNILDRIDRRQND